MPRKGETKCAFHADFWSHNCPHCKLYWEDFEQRNKPPAKTRAKIHTKPDKIQKPQWGKGSGSIR